MQMVQLTQKDQEGFSQVAQQCYSKAEKTGILDIRDLIMYLGSIPYLNQTQAGKSSQDLFICQAVLEQVKTAQRIRQEKIMQILERCDIEKLQDFFISQGVLEPVAEIVSQQDNNVPLSEQQKTFQKGSRNTTEQKFIDESDELLQQIQKDPAVKKQYEPQISIDDLKKQRKADKYNPKITDKYASDEEVEQIMTSTKFNVLELANSTKGYKMQQMIRNHIAELAQAFSEDPKAQEDYMRTCTLRNEYQLLLQQQGPQRLKEMRDQTGRNFKPSEIQRKMLFSQKESSSTIIDGEQSIQQEEFSIKKPGLDIELN